MGRLSGALRKLAEHEPASKTVSDALPWFLLQAPALTTLSESCLWSQCFIPSTDKQARTLALSLPMHGLSSVHSSLILPAKLQLCQEEPPSPLCLVSGVVHSTVTEPSLELQAATVGRWGTEFNRAAKP